MIVVVIALLLLFGVYYQLFLKDSALIQPQKYEFRNTRLSASIEGCAKPIDKEETKTKGVEGFCGTSTFGSCDSDSECTREGSCSQGEVCKNFQEEIPVSICIWRDCFKADDYGASCKCVEGKCQWATETRKTEAEVSGTGIERSASVEVVNDTVIYSRALNHLCCRNVMIQKETNTPPIINIQEVWSGIGCKCMCFSEITANITGIPAGTYLVSVYESGTKPGGEEPLKTSLIISQNVTVLVDAG